MVAYLGPVGVVRMTLIEDVARLRIRLMISRKEPWSLGKRSKIAEDMADYAPAFLEVLECFQEGDADKLTRMISAFEEQLLTPEPALKILRRLQKAAKLMEEAAQP